MRLLPLSLQTGLPRFSRGIFRFCVFGTLFFLALHGVYWLPAWPLPLGGLMGAALATDLPLSRALTLLAAALLAVVWVPLVPLAVVVPWVRARTIERVATGAGSKWAFRPWLHSLGWIAVMLGHVALDVDPAIGLTGCIGLALLLPESRKPLERAWQALGRRVERLDLAPARDIAPWVDRLGFLPVLAVAAAAWIPAATDGVRLGALLALAGLLLAVHFGLGRLLVLRDRFLFAVFGLALIQFALALAPLFRAPADARLLGAGMASSFVECAGPLFVSIPRCSDDPAEVDRCRTRSTIDEFFWNGERFVRAARHRFFSSRYAGHPTSLGCVEGQVQLSLDVTRHGDVASRQNLVEFDALDPTRVEVDVLGPGAGKAVAYDPGRKRAFYSTEQAPVLRRDLATGALQPVAAALEPGRPQDLGFDPARDLLLALEEFGQVSALAGETLELVATYPILNGREFSLDPERGLAYVAGNFGFEVIDLEAGRVTARHRIGLEGRRPALDRCNHVVYVATTASGRLHAFDRDSLRSIGSVALGTGSRPAYVSRDGRWLFAGSVAGHYYWDAAALAAKLRGGGPPAPPDAGCAAAQSVAPAGERLPVRAAP